MHVQSLSMDHKSLEILQVTTKIHGAPVNTQKKAVSIKLLSIDIFKKALLQDLNKHKTKDFISISILINNFSFFFNADHLKTPKVLLRGGFSFFLKICLIFFFA